MSAVEEHAASIREAVDGGELDGLVDVVLVAAVRAPASLDVLLELSDDSRARLAECLSEPYSAYRGDIGRLERALVLLRPAYSEPDDRIGAERQRRYDELARQHTYLRGRQAGALIRAERDAGREVSAATVAALRRTAPGSYEPYGLVELAAEFTEPVLNVGEAWSDRALAELPALGEPWERLLRFALTAATAAKPTAKWEKAGRALIAEIGADAVRETVVPWLALVGSPRTLVLDGPGYETADVNRLFDGYNADALRGLAWLLSLPPPRPETVRVLGAFVETSLVKLPGLGPRSPKLANAGVVALSRIDGEAALAELARLSIRITYRATLKLVDTALDTRAEALGLSREEIEELAVPAYGLTEVGRSVRQLGGATAELRVQGGKAALSWHDAAGKPVKSVPAAVRRDHAEEVKELKAAVKDIDKMLGAQSERLDKQFLARRSWAYSPWRARLLDHPLVGTLARRLLWTVDGTAYGFAGGELRGLDDEPLGAVSDDAAVELWHPIGRESAEVLAWRGWLERHTVTQPFKQAHREVYLLTDAERATGTYSNRFAAHILRQHQFHALAAVRGWRNILRMREDGNAPPATRELPQWGLRAEFWIAADDNGGQDNGGQDDDVSGSSSAYLRLRTDQVRFYPLDAPRNAAHFSDGDYRMRPDPGREPVEPLPLTEIPAPVLSEILRDVDLFVGVASVGNDPTWQDGGPGGRFRAYWTSYGFGELNQSAETRRDILTRLLPRLAIGGQCAIEGRYLHVKGSRHTYKIHLGSANVLMTPNDQYLCIVPTSATGPDPGYLPFEGDRTLAVILSKAMLLARDGEITDPTVLSQL